MLKYSINYKLLLTNDNNEDVLIQSYYLDANNTFNENNESFTIDVEIEKNVDKEQNCKIKIYNLNETTRKSLYKSKTDKSYRNGTLYSGYSNNLQLLFSGNILQCLSKKEGNNWITYIVLESGLTARNLSYSNISIKTGNILDKLLKDIPNVKSGYITSNNSLFKNSYRGRCVEGNTYDILKKNNKNNNIFIDNEKLYIVNENEVLTADEIEISNESGLISVEEQDEYIEVKMLFEPLANLNNKCSLITKQSDNPVYQNGTGIYKIIGFTHSITISKTGGQEKGESKIKLEMLKKNTKEIKK